MALLACVIAESAPAYCVLMAFSSSVLEAFLYPRDALGDRLGHRLSIEHRLLCHELPFLRLPTSSTARQTRKKRDLPAFYDFTFSQSDST